jgi:leader peptidase (prepilin peptidase) / N-methyltransferase
VSGLGVLLVGALGLVVGSAVWVASRARATDRAVLSGQVCANPACGAPLGPLGWLPLLGAGAARRCGRCGATQPGKRVAFELAVAGYYALAAATLGDDGVRLVAVLVFAVPLLVVLLVDWWTRFIHTDVIGLGLLLGLGFAVEDGLGGFLEAVLSAVGAVAVFGLFFVLAAVIYRNLRVVPFGLGDVYLAAMIGAMTRYPAVIQALFAGIFLAGLGSLLLLLTRRAGRRDPIPYGPYLCVGGLLALLS